MCKSYILDAMRLRRKSLNKVANKSLKSDKMEIMLKDTNMSKIHACGNLRAN